MADTPDVVFSQGFRSSSKTVERRIDGPDRTADRNVRKTVIAAEVDGQSIFEADILIPARTRDGLEAIGIKGEQFRWKDGVIP